MSQEKHTWEHFLFWEGFKVNSLQGSKKKKMISKKLKQTPIKELGYLNKSIPPTSTKKNKPSSPKKIYR